MTRVILPYNTQVIDLLWSINEKLSGRTGFDFKEPTHEWAFEVIEDVESEIEQAELALKKLDKKQ